MNSVSIRQKPVLSALSGNVRRSCHHGIQELDIRAYLFIDEVGVYLIRLFAVIRSRWLYAASYFFTFTRDCITL